jgi:hypothetical protein
MLDNDEQTFLLRHSLRPLQDANPQNGLAGFAGKSSLIPFPYNLPYFALKPKYQGNLEAC